MSRPNNVLWIMRDQLRLALGDNGRPARDSYEMASIH